MEQNSDEIIFTPETVEPIVYNAIEDVLKDKIYNDQMVQVWIDDICSRISKALIEQNKPYKYIVSCTVMQKTGAGLHLGYACHWDISNDNTVVARWPNEKRKDPNARVVCIATVYGLNI